MDLIKFNQQNIPKTFDESFFHIQKVRILKNIKILQNMVFYGFEGKKVFIDLLLKQVYPITNVKPHTFKINKLECNCLHSDYHIEINVKTIQTKEIDIILDIIKEYSLSSSILNIPYKIIVIYNFDCLSHKFQYKLRTLIEKLSINSRFILHVKQLTNIIPPLLSRLICIRISSPSKTEIVAFCKYMSKKYKISVTNIDKIISQVSENNIVSLSRLMCLIFIKLKSKDDKIRYTIKTNNQFEELVNIITSQKTLEDKLSKSKNLLLTILQKNYDDNDVFKNVLNIILNKNIDREIKYSIIEKTLYYSNITNKNRNVIILETYLVYLISIFDKINLKK